MKLRVTVNGQTFEVEVDILEESAAPTPYPAAAPPAAAQPPVQPVVRPNIPASAPASSPGAAGGKVLSSPIPGTVVEKQPGELYRTVPVAADGLAQFRTQWSADRDQALQRNALRIIQANARFYLRLSREIDAADAELQKSRSIPESNQNSYSDCAHAVATSFPCCRAEAITRRQAAFTSG